MGTFARDLSRDGCRIYPPCGAKPHQGEIHPLTGPGAAPTRRAKSSQRRIGSLLVTSVTQRDLPVIQGIVLILAIFIVLMHIGIDVLYTLIDPRIRFGRVEA